MSPIRLKELAIFKSRTSLVLLAVSLTVVMVAGLGLTLRNSAVQISAAAEQASDFAEVRGDLISTHRELSYVLSSAGESGDRRWESRYRTLAAQLHGQIQASQNLAFSEQAMLSATKAQIARDKMVVFEEKAFDMIRRGDKNGAASSISDPAFNLASSQFDREINAQLSLVRADLIAQRETALSTSNKAMAGAVIALLVLSLIWWTILRDAQKRGRALASAQAELLAYRDELEDRVRNRTRDLQVSKTKAEAASKAKSEFLAVMSHEIRTPLNGVMGMSTALAATELNSDQSDMLGTIQKSGQILLTILNDVLDLSKIEAGEIKIGKEAFAVRDVVEPVIDLYKATAQEKGLELVLECSVAEEYRFESDPARLRQIVSNFISNALKFTEKGKVTLSIDHQADADGDNYLVFNVIDTGIGIDESAQKTIFEKFTQIDGSLSRKFEGTGLGLAICSELVHHMGGEISLKSTEGEGSWFRFFVPVNRLQDEICETEQTQVNTAKIQKQQKIRILVAEDNKTNRMVIKAILAPLNAEIIFAEDGMQAVDIWQTSKFDLVLMDIQMPNMNGVDATKAIRELEQSQSRNKTPIVAVTANAMPHQRDEYLAAGMDDHVAKPIQPKQLYAAMKQAMAAANVNEQNGEQQTG
ncbi:hypothetical protein MNBD_ALPHA06-972 [hydrothermal vent metagenome]|uniref:Histidine kinase n=1 Tax=hydrothermal vent metagenome TaxID=652676 RepID=A0A3B0S9D5_9ZZZZ